MVCYEQLLDADLDWAMNEGSRHFEYDSAVQVALRKITGRLRDLGIPYAVVGGMALFAHGLRRFTEDVDLLVTEESLKVIHAELEGAGYRPPFAGSKNLRDVELGVRIEFLVAGQFPGDGKPKPVAFPVPSDVCVEISGISYLNLPTLIELKLASGMTNSQRVKDLGDVQELIKVLGLPLNMEEKLGAFVRPRFAEIWHAARAVPQRFLVLWRETFLTTEAAVLAAMRDDGVTVETSDAGGAYLMTTDPDVARKWDMNDESEFL